MGLTRSETRFVKWAGRAESSLPVCGSDCHLLWTKFSAWCRQWTYADRQHK